MVAHCPPDKGRVVESNPNTVYVSDEMVTSMTISSKAQSIENANEKENTA